MDEQRASEIAKNVLQQNIERQNLVKDITAQAQDLLNEESKNHLVNLVWGEKWHEGVLGIVASRLVESTPRPFGKIRRSSHGMRADRFSG